MFSINIRTGEKSISVNCDRMKRKTICDDTRIFCWLKNDIVFSFDQYEYKLKFNMKIEETNMKCYSLIEK